MLPRLILASTSPQRRRLLAEAGYPFVVEPPHPAAECGVCSRETPAELALRMAYQKAADVAPRVSEGLVVACDTVVECAAQKLGKAESREHAAWMLGLLSGREHYAHRGLCLWRRPAGEPRTRLATTTLRMDPLSAREIEEYLDTGLWEGKAGAFGYQDRVGWLRIVEGSESNVIGLPLELLAEMLAEEKGEDASPFRPRP